MNKILLTLGLLLCFSAALGQFNPDITIDGTYCNNVAAGDAGPDEWTNAQNQSYTGASSSCELSELYVDLIEVGADPYLAIGLERGNQGTATFLFYVNTDCDNTTGDTSIGPAPGNLSRAGAEYRIQIEAKNNGTVDVEDVSAWNGAGYTTTPPSGEIAATGQSDGCGGTNSNFLEFGFPLSDLFDVCEATDCNSIEFTVIETKSGGSINSSDCQQVGVSITVEINEPPAPAFAPDMTAVCLEDSPVINLDASSTVDLDLVNGDMLDWSWTSDNTGTFGTVSGTGATATTMLSTTYTPTVGGTHNITLTTKDRFDCEVTTVEIPIVVSAAPTGDCTLMMPVRDCSVSTDLTFDASGMVDLTGPNNLIYAWDFGDGGTSSAASGTYSYAQCSTATITLTVTDPDSVAPCNTFVCVWTVLPVELVSFKGELQGHSTAKLSWVTATEKDNEKFIVQRRIADGEFEDVAEVAGAGTTDVAQHYTYEDELPIGTHSKVYYRLQQVDFDATISYSDIIFMKLITDKDEMYILGNRGENHTVNFNMSATRTLNMVTVYNMMGQPVRQLEMNEVIRKGAYQLNVDLSGLTSGTYIIAADFKDGRLTTKTLK